MTTSYFPSTEVARLAWVINYRDKLPLLGPKVGLGGEEIANTQSELNFYVWLHRDYYPPSQTDPKESTVYRNFMDTGSGTVTHFPPPRTPIPDPPPVPLPGILTRLFAQIAGIKSRLEFNDYIGNELGILGSGDTVQHPWPEFSLNYEQGPEGRRVSINFTKYGHDGVWIESRINGGEWMALGADNSKPHYDTRPLLDPNLPEVREYRLRWWDKGEPNGEFSPIQKIVVAG